jgi:hypothetical protein
MLFFCSTPTPHHSHNMNTIHNHAMVPPYNHTIFHNFAHKRAMTSKPFLFPSQRPYAPSDASAASVPLLFPRPKPTTITDIKIHNFHLSRPRPIRGEAISPLICIKPLPLAFE